MPVMPGHRRVAQKWPKRSLARSSALRSCSVSKAFNRAYDLGTGAVEQGPVVALDHRHAGSHQTGQARTPIRPLQARSRRTSSAGRRSSPGLPRPPPQWPGAHSRRRKPSRSNRPPRPAGNSSGVSSRGGSASSAASARRGERYLPARALFVFPRSTSSPLTISVRRTVSTPAARSMSRRSSACHSSGRSRSRPRTTGSGLVRAPTTRPLSRPTRRAV